jgi:hypothetical protein
MGVCLDMLCSHTKFCRKKGQNIVSLEAIFEHQFFFTEVKEKCHFFFTSTYLFSRFFNILKYVFLGSGCIYTYKPKNIFTFQDSIMFVNFQYWVCPIIFAQILMLKKASHDDPFTPTINSNITIPLEFIVRLKG